jgi:hypothetical protein
LQTLRSSTGTSVDRLVAPRPLSEKAPRAPHQRRPARLARLGTSREKLARPLEVLF